LDAPTSKDAAQAALITDYYKPITRSQTKLMLLTEQGQQNLNAHSSSSLSKGYMPIWQAAPKVNENAHQPRDKATANLKDSKQRRNKPRKAFHEASEKIKVEVQQRAEKGRLRKAKREVRDQEKYKRYLKLHNELSSESMTLHDVQLKFKKKRQVLREAINNLEARQCDAMVNCFAKVGVQDPATL
jgi:hypothetical protein